MSQLEAVPGYAWADQDGNPVDGPVFSGPERSSGGALGQAAAYRDLAQCVHCGGIYDMSTCRKTAFYPVHYRWETPCCKRMMGDAGPATDYRLVLLWPGRGRRGGRGTGMIMHAGKVRCRDRSRRAPAGLRAVSGPCSAVRARSPEPGDSERYRGLAGDGAA